MTSDLDDLVAAYWRHHALSTGDRKDRLGSEEWFWAWEQVESAVEDGADNVLPLLDALIWSPEADLAYLGAGPLEEALVKHPDLFAAGVADRCRRNPLWRQALAHVWLQPAERRRLDALCDFLQASDS